MFWSKWMLVSQNKSRIWEINTTEEYEDKIDMSWDEEQDDCVLASVCGPNVSLT